MTSRRLPLLLLCSLAVFLAAPAGAEEPAGLNEEALGEGEIFVWTEPVEGFDYPRLITTAVIDAPPEQVYEVVTNCDRFAERLHRIKAAKTLKKTPTSHVCVATLGLPFPLSDLTAVTIDQRQQGPDQWHRKWKLMPKLKSSYEHMVGAYIMTPFGGEPGRTLLRYEIHVIPKTSVPNVLRKRAQLKSMPKMIDRVRLEVTKL